MPDNMHVARWLKRKRTERFPRQEDARNELRRLTGVTIGASTWAQWESGSRVPRMTNKKLIALIDFFGDWKDVEPDTEAPAPEGTGDILAALRLQIGLNQTLTARLTAADEDRARLTAEVDRLAVRLEDVLERLDGVDARLGLR